jgi:hypothetical protein
MGSALRFLCRPSLAKEPILWLRQPHLVEVGRGEGGREKGRARARVKERPEQKEKAEEGRRG